MEQKGSVVEKGERKGQEVQGVGRIKPRKVRRGWEGVTIIGP